MEPRQLVRSGVEAFNRGDADALATMVCVVENIFRKGEWAILEWRDPWVFAVAASSIPIAKEWESPKRRRINDEQRTEA